MVRNYKPKPGYKRMLNYSEEDLQEAIKAVENGLSQRQACKQFRIPRGTLQNKLAGRFPGRHGGQTVFSELEEKAFAQHILSVSKWGFPIDFLEFRMLVKKYLEKRNRSVERFNNNIPSNDWVRSFLKRHSSHLTIRLCQNIATKRADVSPESIIKYFDNLEVTLADIPPTNILNYDETNLSDNPGKKRCIFRRGVKYPERILNSTKASTSMMFSCTANGQMLPTYVVYKAKHLMNTWTEGGPVKTRYNRSKSGWFDATCFFDWFLSFLVPWAKSVPGKTVVIGDNLSSHFTEDSIKACLENDISFVCLPPNSTHLCQPLDVGVFSSLKANWRAVLSTWKQGEGRRSATLPKDAFPKLLTKLMERLEPVMEVNVTSGFRRSGIYPTDRCKVLDHLPSNDRSATEQMDTVSKVFIQSLEQLRYEQVPKQRRKRVSVEPGKSVGLEDIPSTSNDDAPAAKRHAPQPVTTEPPSTMTTSDDSDESDNSYESDSETDQSTNEDFHLNVKVGRWVIVKFPVRSRVLHYVGQVMEEVYDSDNDKTSPNNQQCSKWEVKFLRKSAKSAAFVPPRHNDIAVVMDSDIVRVLPDPKISKRLHTQFPLEFSTVVLTFNDSSTLNIVLFVNEVHYSIH